MLKLKCSSTEALKGCMNGEISEQIFRGHVDKYTVNKVGLVWTPSIFEQVCSCRNHNITDPSQEFLLKDRHVLHGTPPIPKRGS